jgi:DHA1 family tetracycline resistance protein-like MFS transporter
LRKPHIVILFTVLLDAIGIGLIMPILPGLLHSLANSDAAVSRNFGTLAAAYALMQFLFSPVLGALSDRFGRRPVLLASLAGAAVDYLVMAAAPNLAWLYVGRVLAGITGANMAVASAYLTDVTSEAERAGRFGQMGAALGVGFIAGPLIGGLLGALHLRAPFLAAAAMNGLNLLLAYFVLPESRKQQSSPREKRSMNAFATLHRLRGAPNLISLVGVYAVIMLASQAPATLWIIYGEDRFAWTTTIAGVSLAAFGACHALSQAFAIGPLVARLGERVALLIGLAADSLGLVLMAIATRGWMPFAILPLFAVGGVTMPSLQAMLARQIDDSRQGELQGTLTSIASLIGVGGPLAATWLYAASQRTWPGLVWAIGAALYLLVLPLLFNSRARSQQDDAVGTSASE